MGSSCRCDMRKIAALLLILICLPLHAQQVRVDNLRVWAAPDHTRLVFDTSGPVNHKLFALNKPDRLVIDISNAKLQGKLPAADDNPLIKRLRSAERKGGGLRVVLDLKKPSIPRVLF